jgi:hypothetical protein
MLSAPKMENIVIIKISEGLMVHRKDKIQKYKGVFLNPSPPLLAGATIFVPEYSAKCFAVKISLPVSESHCVLFVIL